MRILFIHNHYRQYGGEDAVSKSEYDLLARKGETIHLYERGNQEFDRYSPLDKASRLFSMAWSNGSYEDVKKIIKDFCPDVAHVYNTHFMVTPAVYYACQEANVPVVQSLYNFRWMCANALFLRNGKHCEECMTRSRWRSVFYRCYRNSALLTACVVKALNTHWQEETWMRAIDAYIVATGYARKKFVEAGIPQEKIFIKPHFIYPDPGMRRKEEGYAFYVGRISEEKGVGSLLKAWEALGSSPLKIMGEGPLLAELKSIVLAKGMSNIEILGYRPEEEYRKFLSQARFLIVPSIGHDNFPRTIAEAYSYGVPVLASSVEGIKEYVKEKVTGATFQAGDAADLANKARWLFKEGNLAQMGRNARREFEEHYTAEKNYEFLSGIYRRAMEHKKGRGLFA